MTATFAWHEWNTAGKTEDTSISNCNWGNVDESDIDYTIEAKKIPVGSNSYTKYLTGYFSGTYALVGPNGKFWVTTSLPANVTMKGTVTNTYATPSTSASGDADSTTFDTEGEATAVNFGSTPENATTSTSAANPAYTGYIRTQIQTTGSAATGLIGSQTLNLKYDES